MRLMCLMVLVGVLSMPLLAAPLAVFDCRERVARTWPRVLVTYPVSFDRGQARVGRVRLVDAAGTEQPCQFSRVETHNDGSIKSARLSFYAELPKGGSYHYELVPGKPAAGTPVATTLRDGLLTLDNGVTAIRLPAGTKAYKTPLSLVFGHRTMAPCKTLEAAGLAFGPVDGVRLADGSWVTGSYFATEPMAASLCRLHASVPNEIASLYRTEPPTAAEIAATKAAAPTVTSYATTITERGPLFTEARVRFAFSNGHFYQMTVRVLPGDPAIRMDELCDLPGFSPPDAPIYMEMAMGAAGGWQPDAAFCYNNRRQEHHAALEGALKGQGFTPQKTTTAIPYTADEHAVSDLTAHYPWNLAAHILGVVKADELRANKAAPFLALVPMHAGSWRNAQFCFPPKPQEYQTLVSYADGDLIMRWTIRAQPHPQNVLHTGEFDPDFGLEGIRRLWCLVAGPFQYYDTLVPFRTNDGYINLDNYKDWTLAWSDDTRAAAVTPQPVITAGYSPVWQINANMTTGEYPWFTHFLTGADAGTWSVPWRAKLADPKLTPEQRGELRAEVAAFCELVSEPDFNTRASMTHQGNPNMPINRFMALPFAAALIPDHPRAKAWMETTAQYLRYKLGMNTVPGGAWSELVTYYYASLPMLANGTLVLQDVNRLDEATRRLTVQPLEYTLQLISPPDPRFGSRVVPGFGHEGILGSDGRRTSGAHWLTGAALERDHDLAKAAVFAWGWDQIGRPGSAGKPANPFDVGFDTLTVPAQSDLAAKATPEMVRQVLRSTWQPGSGAVLRAHVGEANETYLGYRQGFMASHSDANQGDFTLYAHGVPLVPLSLLGYAISNFKPYVDINREFGWHSRVRFGDMRDWGGWPGGGPVSGIHRHSFSDSVDYLRGIGDYGPQRWTRQILFLKGETGASPNYFVFRDSFTKLDHLAGAMAASEVSAPATVGELQPKWWYLRTLGHTTQVAANPAGLDYASEWGPQLNVRFLQPASVAITSREATAGTKTCAGADETITVNAAGPIPAGQDVLVVLYPQAKGEVAPAYQALADGAAKITTRESTDYVFQHHQAMTYQSADVAFAGIAGAVRVFPDEVHLVVAEGGGMVRYKGFTLLAGEPATKVITMAELAKGGTEMVPAPETLLAFALDERSGPITALTPGVRKQALPNGAAYEFNSPTPFSFAQDGVVFTGRRGGLVIDDKQGTVRVVLLDGEKIGARGLLADVASGPYDVTFHRDRITAVTEGPARFIHLTMPAGLTQLPTITIAGLSYAPGTDGNTVIVPVQHGRFTFTVENLQQPAVFRSWQEW
jgi:hypothetical protein